VVEGRSSAGVLPSEEEGLKRSQSRRSSPDTAEHSENGATSGFSGGLGVGGWRWWTASAASRCGREQGSERECKTFLLKYEGSLALVCLFAERKTASEVLELISR
jgi:hypothetical protein